MNKLLNKFEPGLLIVFVATTLAAWPFLSQPSLPTDTDAEIHIFRADQVERSIVEGVYYPRWAPDFYYGNGYPIFNYYAPLAYHLAAYYSLATGLGVVAGSKFVLVIAAFIGSLGMYLFVANRWGRVEAMVAGEMRRGLSWSDAESELLVDRRAPPSIAPGGVVLAPT